MTSHRLSAAPSAPAPAALPLGALVRVVAILALGIAVLRRGRPARLSRKASAPTLCAATSWSPGDAIRFGDLVAGAPAEAAATPVFHAPALGAVGTIQVRAHPDDRPRAGRRGRRDGRARSDHGDARRCAAIDQDAVAAALAQDIAAVAGAAAGRDRDRLSTAPPPALLTEPWT